MKKKIICIFIVLSVIASCLAVSLEAYAKSMQLTLDVQVTAAIDGADDLLRFTYVPDESGVYSFLSYNVYASEAYLFVQDYDKEASKKKFTQLAYATNDPNYQENNHNSGSFA